MEFLYHISWWRSVNDANDQKLQDRSSTCSHLVWTQIEAKTSQDYMNIKLCRTVSLPKTPATIYSSNSIDFLGIETLIHWRHKERSPKRRQNTPSDVQRSVMTVFTRHKNLFFSPHACMARHRHFVSMTTSRLLWIAGHKYESNWSMSLALYAYLVIYWWLVTSSIEFMHWLWKFRFLCEQF